MRKSRPNPVANASSAQARYTDGTHADALSLHTTPSDYEYDDDDSPQQPPSYSDSEAAVSQSRQLSAPEDQYARIKQPSANEWRQGVGGKPVSMNETSIRMDPRLDDDPDRLFDYITDYLRVVQPNPAVRITGHHQQTTYKNNKKETERVVDFDFSFSFRKYLRPATPGDEETWWQPRVVDNGDRALRGGWKKSRANGYTQDVEITGDVRPDLMDWCRDYCSSKSSLKVFRVEREVAGLDAKMLAEQLEAMIRSTHYRGHINTFFPVEDRNVDIYSQHIINRWRLTWVRYIFYVTFLWIFTWPLLFFFTARWGIYRVTWAFSRKVQTPQGGRTEYASVDERTWLRQHENLIKNLAVEGHQGDATDFPTEVEARPRRTPSGRIQTGHAGVDGAIDFVQGGMSAWNALQGRNGSSGPGWGGDST